MPPSAVANTRPSAVVTDADRASVASTDARSAASGNATRAKRTPSVERSTAPPAPTTQQVDADGADPAVSRPAPPAKTLAQVEPPSVERATSGPLSRQRIDGSGEATTTSGLMASVSATTSAGGRNA